MEILMNVSNLHIATSIALALGSTLATPSACAQTFDAVRLYAAPPGKNGGTIGAVVLAGTQYQGSDERRTLVLPVLDYQWANGWFAGVTNGVGFNFSDSPQTQYGLRLTADLGRNEDRSSALRGLGDVDAKAEGGAFFNYALPQGVSLSSSLRYGSGQDGKGLLLDLGAGYSTTIGSQWRIGAGAALTAANGEYLQSYFGVTTAQAVRSGYAVYTPKAGIRDVRANVSLTYALDPRTRIMVAVSVSSLHGDAKESPLTKQRTAGSGLVAVSYAY
jgi:MipA family protein